MYRPKLRVIPFIWPRVYWWSKLPKQHTHDLWVQETDHLIYTLVVTSDCELRLTGTEPKFSPPRTTVKPLSHVPLCLNFSSHGSNMHCLNLIAFSPISSFPVSRVMNNSIVSKEETQWHLHSGGGILLFYVLIYKCLMDKIYLAL